MEQPATSRHPIVGSWSVTVESDGTQTPYLFTMSPGYGLTMSSASVLQHGPDDPHAMDGPVFMSAGHGTWRTDDGNSVFLTFVRLVADGTGVYLGRRVTRARIQVDTTSDGWTGEFVTDVLGPEEGTPRKGRGTIRAERIQAEAPGEPSPMEDTIRGVKP